MTIAHRSLETCVLLALWLASTAPADVVTIQPSSDNTLFQDATGSLSNGAGPVLFAGNSGQGLARRALIGFDVAGAVPAGRRIEEVTLTLYVSNSPNTILRTFTLHRAFESWGEGSSSTTSGSGAPATDGDATWLHTSWPNQLWATVGGHYAATPSAAQQVGGVGFYTWTDSPMTADVQSWLDDPAGNHGWLVLGDEVTLNTARRFDSRENAVPENRPALMVRFSNIVGVTSGRAPALVTLGPCRPNPSAERTRIGFGLPRRAHARLDVVDLAGRRVATLVDAWVEAGWQEAVWDGRDVRGGRAGSGVYFCRLTVDDQPVAAARAVRLR